MVKRLSRLTLFAIFLNLLPLSQAFCAPPQGDPPEIRRLSRILTKIQTALATQYGFDQIMIGGGSARAILDHVYFGGPLQFRDLDIFVVAHQTVTSKFADDLGRALEATHLGTYQPNELRPRPRGGTNAGFGFSLNTSAGDIIDLSIYHSDAALDRNGIFDVDRVMIPLRQGESLQSTLARMVSVTPNQAIRRNWIIDREGGYPAWQRQRPSIVNWGEIERDPILQSIRVLRTYLRSGRRSLPLEVRRRLKTLIEGVSETNRLQIVRNTLKLLHDPEAAFALKELGAIGFFEKISPALGRWISGQSIAKLTQLLGPNQLSDVPSAAERLTRLLERVSPRERLPFLRTLRQVEPEFFSHEISRLIRPRRGQAPLRLGYFTGDFAPFHNGHLSVAQAALNAGPLNLLFIIPTPHATNDPKTKRFSIEEWRERQRFVDLGSRSEDRIIPWWPVETPPSSGKPQLRDILSNLERSIGSPGQLTHVAGGDSLHRIVGRNLLVTDPRPRIVVTRGELPIPVGATTPESGVRLIRREGELPVSSTRILHELAAQGHTSHLTPAVLEEVQRLPRYQEIVEDLREHAADIRRLPARARDLDRDPRTFILDLSQNPDGHYISAEDGLPRPTDGYFELIRSLVTRPTDQFLIFLGNDPPKDAALEWSLATLRLRNRQVLITRDYRHIKPRDRIRVFDSGIAAHLLETGGLFEKVLARQRIITYDFNHAPASPLLEAAHIPVIRLSSTSGTIPHGCIPLRDVVTELTLVK